MPRQKEGKLSKNSTERKMEELNKDSNRLAADLAARGTALIIGEEKIQEQREAAKKQ